MKRKGKPLLVAAVGVALVSYAGCGGHHPVGNMRGPDNAPEAPDAGVPEEGGPQTVLGTDKK